MKSILFLTSGRRAPSSRFRVLQFVPRLRADGFRASVAPCFPDKYLSHYDFRFGGLPLGALLTGAKCVSRLLSILRAPFYDLVFLERELIPHLTPFFERFAAALNPRIHLDFDDAIHLKYGAADPVARVIRLARGISAGNEWLAAYARRHNPRVTVVPTAIDTDRFTPAQLGDVPFVWTGTSSNLRFLAQIAPALRRVAGARLLVICDRPPDDLGIPTEFVPWSESSEVDALRRGRIGIMPLPDTEWSKGKCGFKILQYLACGIPCVASPVGVNPQILEGGECGLLARTEDEWVDSLTRLTRDAKLARKLAERGRKRVEAYSVNAVYPRFRAAIGASGRASRPRSSSPPAN